MRSGWTAGDWLDRFEQDEERDMSRCDRTEMYVSEANGERQSHAKDMDGQHR